MNRLVYHVARFERGRDVQARDADGGPSIRFGQPARGHALDDVLQRKLHHQRLGLHPRHPPMYPRPVLHFCLGVQPPTVLVKMHHDGLHKLIHLLLPLFPPHLSFRTPHSGRDVAAVQQVDPVHHLHWLGAYDPDQHGSVPFGWHRDFADDRQRLRDWVAVSWTRHERPTDSADFMAR